MKKLIAIAILVAAIPALAGWGLAQEKPDKLEGKRTVYVVRHAAAGDLAQTLGRFLGEKEAQVVAEPVSNCLLITASPAAFAEVVKLLDQLDRRPATVAIEVLVVELAGQRDKLEPAQPDLDEQQFSGSITQVMTRLQALRKQGRLAGLRHLQLSALDNHQVVAHIGENKPMVIGANVNARGGTANAIQYRDVGTRLKVTPKASADGSIQLNLELSDSRLRTPDDGVPIGGGDRAPVVAPEFITTNLTTTLSVASGQAIVAKGFKAEEKSQKSQMLVIASARLVESATANPGK